MSKVSSDKKFIVNEWSYIHVLLFYVSLVRQFETLLFYVVISKIEALFVSRHKFSYAYVENV
jgi:hypothetical protein